MPPFIEVVRLKKDLPLPAYQTDGAAGIDLYASEGGCLNPGESVIVPTGIKVAIPVGYKGMLHGRSGLGFKNGIVPFMGTIDSDYRGEICVKLFNLSDRPFFFNFGDRICQLCIEPAPQAVIMERETLSNTGRGENGFGSTGNN